MVLVKALAGSLCCVLGQGTLLSQCLSSPRCINEYRKTLGRGGGGGGGGGVIYSQLLPATETRISSGLMGH